MNIPDAEVYSALPVVGGALALAAKAFVTDIIDKNRKRSGRPDQQAVPPPHVEMTLGDFRQVADLLKAELNGRYMFASEAREKFNSLSQKLDDRVDELKDCIQAISAASPKHTD